MKFKVLLDGREEEIEVVRQGDSLRVVHDGQTTEVRLLHTEGNHFVLEYDAPGEGAAVYRRRLRAAGYSDGDQRQLWVNGSTLTYTRVKETRPAVSSGPAVGDETLAATIPAVVSEVLVKEGDRVAAGDRLILLESMKMILPITTPFDGIVAKINCAAGNAVRPGVRLIEITATGTEI